MDEIRTRKVLREHAGLESEILQEIAEALGNAGERLERALERVRAAGRRIEGLRETSAGSGGLDGSPRGAASLREEIARYNVLRQEALKQYRHLVIHREAVGFRNHKLVQEKYQIPPRLEPPEE